MKRYWNIYNRIYDLDNIKLAHKMARKWKWYYKEVRIVDSNIDYYCKQIQKMLKEKTYDIQPNDYTHSTIKDWQKERELSKLKYYPHRIIQRCSINSYVWWLLRCNSFRLYEKYIKPLINKLKYYYDNIIRWHKNYLNKLIRKQFITY